MNSDTIRAATPLFLAAMGGVITVVAILAQPPESYFNTISHIASAAIGGAAGAAQGGKNNIEK